MQSLRYLILIAFLYLQFFPSQAQDLPRYMTPAESAIYPQYLLQQQERLAAGITTPPPSPVRTMAEWEEVQAICITWTSYQSILAQIVAAAQQECTVIINCSDSNSVKNYLVNAGVFPVNCRYIETPYNSVWIRDYGPHTCYVNDVDTLVLVEWVYNRPRPYDDAMPEVIAAELGLPLYQTTQSPYTLVNTGGNFVPDGFGQAFSSNLVLDENPSLSTAQVDNILQQFMGIDNYVHLTNLPYDGIHHIDMHMKLLDEETLLMGEFPSGISDGPQIETNLQFILSNHSSAFGTPFRVVRIPMVPSTGGSYPPSSSYRTYTNGVFVNGSYIFPTYYPQWDSTAYRILGENLPGYKLVGINCNSMISASGAIHCITKLIGVDEPLLISHKPVYAVFDTLSPYSISALIKHRSGIQSASIMYRTDSTQSFQSIAMSPGSPGYWEGAIPAQGPGTRIQYYIEAHAIGGKSQVRPITAPTGFWTCEVRYFTGIDEDDAFTAGLPFPNPADKLVSIPVESKFPSECRIVLTDIRGREVRELFNGDIPAGESIQFADVSQLMAGTYILRYTIGNTVKYTKLMVR